LECRYVVFELGLQHFCESGGEVLQLVYRCGDVVLDRQLRQCDGPVNGSAASAQGDVAAARMYGRVTLWMASSITLFSGGSTTGVATDAAMHAVQTMDAAAVGSLTHMFTYPFGTLGFGG